MLIDDMAVLMLNGMNNVPDILLIWMGWIVIVNASDGDLSPIVSLTESFLEEVGLRIALRIQVTPSDKAYLSRSYLANKGRTSYLLIGS